MATADCTARLPYADAYDQLRLKLSQLHKMLLHPQGDDESPTRRSESGRATCVWAAADCVLDCQKLTQSLRPEIVMATGNTPAVDESVRQAATQLALTMETFLLMARHEVAQGNGIEFDAIELLLDGAAAGVSRFNMLLSGDADRARTDSPEASRSCWQGQDPSDTNSENHRYRIAAIRAALLIGLANCGELERLNGAVRDLDQIKVEFPKALRPIRQVGDGRRADAFSEALLELEFMLPECALL